MNIQKFDIFLANLNPRFGTEPGKTRPVVVIQTDLLNNFHPSTLICPVTSKILLKTSILRVHLAPKGSGLKVESDILVDQVRAIDNQRLIKKVGHLSPHQQEKLLGNLHILFLE